MAMTKHQCCQPVWDNFHKGQCQRNGVIERDGKWYCKQHDPEAVKAKEEAKRAQWRAEQDAALAHRRRVKAALKLCEGFTTEELESGTLEIRKKQP